MFWVILLYALFASLFPLSKLGLSVSEPFFFIGARMSLAGVLLIAYQCYRHRHFRIQARDFPLFMLLGLVNIFLTNTAEIWSIQHAESSKMCLIYSLSPFLSALIAYVFLKEVLSKIQWLGLCIGFLGLIPLTFMRSPIETLTGAWGIFSYVELVGLFAVLSSVFGWILLKKIVQKPHYSPIMANGFSMALGGILMLILSYLKQEAWKPIPVSDFSPFILVTLGMCLISNLICYNLYGYLLKRYTATLMSFAGLVTPIFAMLFGWFTLKEPLHWSVLPALGFFALGLGLFHQAEKKKTVSKDPILAEENEARLPL